MELDRRDYWASFDMKNRLNILKLNFYSIFKSVFLYALFYDINYSSWSIGHHKECSA